MNIHKILKGGATELNSSVEYIYTNQSFIIIISLILALFCARVSQNYELPSGFYFIVDNIVSKCMFILVVIFIVQYNVSVGFILSLTYILLLISYSNQHKLEKFTNYVTEYFATKESEDTKHELPKLKNTEKKEEETS